MKNMIRIELCVIFLLSVVLFGCQKEITEKKVNSQLSSNAEVNHATKRAYKDNFETWYQFIPDVANGWDSQNPTPYLAWYPGGGLGHATHMGNAYTFFNQYIPFNPPFFSSVHAPVTQFFSAQLSALGLGALPDEVGSIVYDDNGNSIWFHQTSNATVPVSAVRIEFTGKSDIVGGSGKFTGATGEVNLSGFFNPIDQNDAGVSADGWIAY